MKVAIYGRLLELQKAGFAQFLFDELKRRDIKFCIHEGFYPHLLHKIKDLEKFELFSSHEEIRDKVEFIFSLGGDGTLLDTISLVRDTELPIMGINFGKLGFLSSISADEISNALDALENLTYIVDKRELLHLDSNKPLFDGIPYALNDFTIHRKDTSAMIKIHTYLSGEFLNTYWADGIVVSTPTGSTGYALSCGGPVIYPTSCNFVIAPVAPHNLSTRPLVVPDTSVISFEIEGRSDSFLCTLDSRMETIDTSYQLSIRKEDFPIHLVRLRNEHFLPTLRSKLFWGVDKRN